MIVSVSRPELRGAKGAARKRGRLGNLLDGTLGQQRKASPNPANFCTEVTSASEVLNRRLLGAEADPGPVGRAVQECLDRLGETIGGCELIEIMGRGWGAGDDQRQDPVCLDGDDMLLILQNTFDHEKWC